MLSQAHVKNHIHSNGKKSNYVFCVMWIDKFNIEYISWGFLFIPHFFSHFIRPFLWFIRHSTWAITMWYQIDEDNCRLWKQTSTWNQKAMPIFFIEGKMERKSSKQIFCTLFCLLQRRTEGVRVLSPSFPSLSLFMSEFVYIVLYHFAENNSFWMTF